MIKIIIRKSTHRIFKKKKKFIIIIILKEKGNRKERFLKNVKITRVQKRKIYLNIEFNIAQEKLKSQNPFKDQEIININTIKRSISNTFHMQEMQEIDLFQEIHQEN